MGANKRMRTHAVMCDVLSDLDLVAHILAGNIGPSALRPTALSVGAGVGRRRRNWRDFMRDHTIGR